MKNKIFHRKSSPLVEKLTSWKSSLRGKAHFVEAWRCGFVLNKMDVFV